ncbi:ABC transporter ATP-binding protein [Bordetella pseudohinzii]|uniref:ABC transporter ATP-binding protein n=1 Tax=Bordetella pseudohinzii TaxID=1331258 RepID=A0A0J6EZM4_9BORD|nr:ABC transporter ATP-binding protein [Bordetella pseudohinzii]ANY17532.1 ABC transporter ATP-binding protein [Bordetella pseudohinzii]KMM25760.1 branched-chain amino acid ABC transporter substrate-binding protein [Bordetella pseudohinzii]KXA81749.1 ABC transporter ATP-binding protein [Bordetella pseudohinzii]KXA83012.1 ABC transporter ATP-binding protein [Bordetella pseudohinzii]CUI73305.1 Lipopolysaccharide export system ATP-binding protein LptB [Bordetella pseudohinzii]
MSTAILSIRNLCKSFGQTEIIRGVDLEVREGERHALIGPNGAGKSTLFHLVSGHLAPTSGSIRLQGREIAGDAPQAINRHGLARSFQITNLFPRLSTYENLRLAVMRAHGLQYVFWKFIDRDRRIRAETERLLDLVRLTAKAHAIAGELAYSEQRSLEIAMTLASDPRVILLDEPMAGMSQEETAYTSELIREATAGRTLMIVEHDMDVVFSLSDRISVLVYGQVVATGAPSEIRSNAAVREAYLGDEVTA